MGDSVDVDRPPAPRADGDLLHVDARARVEHGAPLGDGDHRQRPAAAEGGRGSSRRWGRPRCRPAGGAAVADALAVEEHRGVVLLALADHHHAVHRPRVESTTRMALTAAPSAPSLSPRPIHRLAAMAAASVTRTSSIARLRSGAWAGRAVHGADHSGLAGPRSAGPVDTCPARTRSPGPRSWRAAILGRWTHSSCDPNGPLSGHRASRRRQELGAQAHGRLPAGRGSPRRYANVPRIVDVEIMAEVLEALGCVASSRLDRRRAGGRLAARPTLVPEAPYELVEQMRASIVVLGPLLARCGRARVSMPGGDDFGNRPIDIHLNGLAAMGADVRPRRTATSRGASGPEPAGRLVGDRVVLEYPSHTATDNLLMAAVAGQGDHGDRERRPRARGRATWPASSTAMGATVARGGDLAHRGRGGRRARTRRPHR